MEDKSIIGSPAKHGHLLLHSDSIYGSTFVLAENM